MVLLSHYLSPARIDTPSAQAGVNGMEEEFLFCISVSVFLCIFGSKSREQSEDSFSYIVQNFKALKGVNSFAG